MRGYFFIQKVKLPFKASELEAHPDSCGEDGLQGGNVLRSPRFASVLVWVDFGAELD